MSGYYSSYFYLLTDLRNFACSQRYWELKLVTNCCTFWSIFLLLRFFFWFSLFSLPYDKQFDFLFQTPHASPKNPAESTKKRRNHLFSLVKIVCEFFNQNFQGTCTLCLGGNNGRMYWKHSIDWKCVNSTARFFRHNCTCLKHHLTGLILQTRSG